jgi:1,4-alpha-glucan branching enzyme
VLTADDLHLFNEGTHARLHERLGAQVLAAGTAFAVWAPSATAASVMGDFNGWDDGADPLAPLASSGIWQGTVAAAKPGQAYKYRLRTPSGDVLDKADPYAFSAEEPPRTASIVCDLAYEWGDASWMEGRGARLAREAPVAIYEVHLGSWRRSPDDPHKLLGYRDLAPLLADHCERLGFTHVELMPVMEHPYYGSWGYQVTGYFAATSRHGSPQDLMALIDHLHQRGIGVLLDWVPAHFPHDAYALGRFDGTALYEHADPRQGLHPDWDTLIFNYGRNEVRSFLLSSADFWMRRYHADGLRVDAVASMLYLDYSRGEGAWIPNPHGGRENLDAVSLLRRVNEHVYAEFSGGQTIAEESTAWPGVSAPTYAGGLGFGFKWDMGWMNDSLRYIEREPVHRRHHHDDLTRRLLWAFSENYVLPLSHDEVVHGKGSLLSRMPGDEWQRFANLRLLLAHMYGQPGKKLLFQGAEIAQIAEWDHERSIDWHLRELPLHAGVERLVGDLNRLYRTLPALHALDCEPAGFEWVEGGDTGASVLAWLRHARGAPSALIALNFTPVPRIGYGLGVPVAGHWRELLNTDAEIYGGSGLGNAGGLDTIVSASHGHPQSLLLDLPPLACLWLQAEAS